MEDIVIDRSDIKVSNHNKYPLNTYPYLVVLKELIEFIKNHHIDIFDENTIECLTSITLLNDNCLCLISRLILRKYTWIRSDSVLKYIPNTSPKDILSYLDELKSLNLVDIITDNTLLSFEDVFDAMKSSFNNSELKEICKTVKLIKVTTKEEMINGLLKIFKIQKTLFGTSSTSFRAKLPKMMNNILKSKNCYLLRMSPILLNSIRRSQRILTISTDNNSLGVSITCPLVLNSPLMVAFKRVRFANYTISHSIPLFTSRRLFEQWEAANEIRHALELASEFDSLCISPLLAKNHDLVKNIIKNVTASISIFDTNISSATSISCMADKLFINIANNDNMVDKFPLSYTIIISLIAGLCLIAYKDEISIDTINLRPNFLVSLDAGALLASATRVAASIFEKETSRNWEFSIIIRMLILDTPFSKNGRGSLYERICIDLVHLKMYNEALKFAKKGLEDSSVKMGDRIIIQRRMALIQARQSKLSIVSSPLLSYLNLHDFSSIDSFYRIIEYYLSFNNEGVISSDSATIKLSIDNTSSPWTCLTCTYINPSCSNSECAICNTARRIETVSMVSNNDKNIDISIDINNINCSNSNNDVICLLCDSDNDFEERDEMKQSDREIRIRKEEKSNNKATNKSTKKKKKSNIVEEELILNVTSDEIDALDFANDIDSIKDEYNEESDDADLIDPLHEGDLALLGLPSTIDDNSDIDVVIIKGRRFGDSKRKGKNVFCSSNDELVSVEDLYLQKCYCIDADDCIGDDIGINNIDSNNITNNKDNIDGDNNRSAFSKLIGNGGWQGWHCEGAPIRTLYGIVFWDVIFMDVNDVFHTPYQSAPLDIRTSSFYHTRLKEINELLLFLLTCSNEDLINMIGDRYRDNYRAQCIGVSWKIPLKTLQLIAVCIGGKGLSIIFRAYAVNYIHFSSGAPDLLLIRISKETKEKLTDASTSKRKFDLVNNSQECIDLSVLLGDSWKTLGSVERVSRWGKKTVDDLNNLNEPISQTTRRKSLFNNNKINTNSNNNTKKKEEENNNIFMNQNDDGDENDDRDIDNEIFTSGSNMDDNEGDYKISSYNPFQCNQTNLILPNNNNTNGKELWKFECMFIEVKGPSDHLAQKQIIWLKVLKQAFPYVLSAVGLVKEEKITKPNIL